MIDTCDLYTHDTGKIVTPNQWVYLLNRAQDKLIADLGVERMTDLHETETGKALNSSGAFSLQTLPYELWHGLAGIRGIQHTDGKFCNKISFAEYRNDVDWSKTYTDDYPAYYVLGNNIYILPYAGHTIDIYYTHKPLVMALAVSDTGSDTDCELDDMYHTILSELALEDYIDLSPEIGRAYNHAVEWIKETRQQIMPSDSLLNGTKRSPSHGDSRWGFLRR